VESLATAAPGVVANEPATEVVAGELEYIERQAGGGVMPVAGDRVFVHYTGTLEDGTVFDTSADRGVPIDFVLGRGEVIPGWDQGIAMMREGGKATLIIPPNLAYGASGSGSTIPPNATLTFEVELVSVVKPPQPEAVAEDDYVPLSPGVGYHDIRTGDGEVAEGGDRVSLHFSAWIQGGEFLTSTEEQGQPAIYTLGSDEVFLNEWDEAVVGMKVGGQRQLLITPEAGSAATPPGDTLILELELLEIVEPMVRTVVEDEDYATTESGLRYYDIVMGDGETAEAGKTVSVHYTGWLLDSETQFDSSLERGVPAEFILGLSQVIPGWDEGVAGMKVGGQRQLIVPPELAFGAEGRGRVPPDTTLLFEVELLEVRAGS
jgi:peptidylprolyl isomerase